jgi:DNA-directed RNA polymerase subunit RPC12/RpoP
MCIQSLQKVDKKSVIVCPHCKAEYLAGEIYMPGALIGQPPEIVKDSFGKIVYVDYHKEDNMPNMIENYTCEYCGKPFVIEATVSYKSMKELPENDFSSPYVSLID